MGVEAPLLALLAESRLPRSWSAELTVENELETRIP